MGYFSNGSEGEDYFETHCVNCLHDNEAKQLHCPIWNLHLLHNYDECNNPKSILHALIPRKEGGGNGKCLMFVDRGTISNMAIERYDCTAISHDIEAR